MKTKSLSIVLVVLSLAMSTLACSLTSNQKPSTADSVPSTDPTSADPSLKEIAPTEAALVESLLNQAEQSGGVPTDVLSSIPALSSIIPAKDLNGDGIIDICEAVPVEAWEMVLARPMVGDPTPFDDSSLGKGCSFDFGKDSEAAYFSYVTFASEKQFNDALASSVKAEPVTTIGDSAFLNYGADARQLWVRKGDKAVMVAIGDMENVEGMLLVAPYLLKALP
jgi:hypothetical protein